MTLEFSLNQTAPASATVDCIVVGAFADGSLTPAAQALDAASSGRIRALLERGDVSGKTGKSALLTTWRAWPRRACWWSGWARPASSACRSTSRRWAMPPAR